MGFVVGRGVSLALMVSSKKLKSRGVSGGVWRVALGYKLELHYSGGLVKVWDTSSNPVNDIGPFQCAGVASDALKDRCKALHRVCENMPS